MKRAKYLDLGFLVLLLLLGGCGRQPAAPGAKSYNGRGIVRKVGSNDITIAHEAFPGYMAAMTMDFSVKNTNELKNLAPGDQVAFKLMVTDEDEWAEQLQRLGHVEPPPPIQQKAEADLLAPHDLMPDFEFVAENGEVRHVSDFRGRALAFTFFFTRCPLPDFCPLMNRNFAAARQLLSASAQAPANWEFLCLSFDSSGDTPAVLSNYARLYRNDNPDRWLFGVISTNTLAAIAPRLDLMVMRDQSGISHNLRTVVLDTQGRIQREFDGNKWTPQDLADAMQAAARAP